MSEAAIAQATTATTAAEEGHKVFVGNLSFGTSSEDLKGLFADQGSIKDAQIIKRGRRSLGYGFVTFETEEDAGKAIAALDKKELNGRVVNVEIAKPPASTKRGHIAEEAAAAAGGEEATAGHEVEGTGRGRGRGRGRGGRRGRGARRGGRARRPPADGETDAAADNAAEQLQGLTVTDAPESAPAVGSMEPDASAEGARGGRGRGRGRGGGRGRGRAPRGAPEGDESKTLVFIANLPFSVDDEALRGLFQGYNVTSAHVVMRQRGPAAGRSKGYGFVDFASEEEQKKAIETFQGFEIEGREIQIKIAIAPSEPNTGVVAE